MMLKKGAYLFQLVLIILALAGGWLGFSYINQTSAQTSGGFLWIFGVIIVTIVALTVGIFINIVLHECGHLVCGLLSGYGFVFFSVLNIAIVKESGKLVRKKYRAPGAGGGCMLSPPDMKDGVFPYKLFVSGGFVVNFVVCAVCFVVFYNLAGTASFWSRAFLVVGIVGAFLGLTNFVPHNVAAPSDGFMLFNLGNEKNAAMRHGWWSTFRIQALVAQGTRPRDITLGLFNWVGTDEVRDMFVFETECNRYKYLLDSGELSEARSLMQALCNDPQYISEMQEMSCHCELLFHELIGECRQEEIDRLYSKGLQGYVKAAHAEIPVRRFMYAYACLALKDADKSKEELDLFGKTCSTPLQSGLVPGERKLIALVDKIVETRTALPQD